MKLNKGGIHIGRYRVTPLGVAVFGALLLALAIIAVIIVMNQISTDPVIGIGRNEPPVSGQAEGETVITPHTPTPAPTLTATAEPTPEPEPTPISARIRFVGEISADSDVLSAALQEDGSYDFSPMLDMVAGAVGDADYTVANVEGPLGGLGEGYAGKNLYNTPESMIYNLQDAGVDMLALANDHALDAFFEGLLGTIDNLRSAGMDYVGAASTQAEHDAPKIIDINGVNVGFLNYTTTLNSKEKATSEDAVKYGVNLAANSNAKADAEAARAAGADILVAVMSWGTDGAAKPDKDQTKIATILVEAGVDVIVGYGPRVIQPVYWLENKDKDGNVTHRTLCATSLGTFLSDATGKNQDFGTIFEFTIQEKEDGSFAVESPKSIPTYVWRLTEGDKTDYRTLACGEWAHEKPEGMSDADYERLLAIWEKIQGVLTDATKVEAN
jgi:poly-gamma-glutamate capsule biosynthesis protein CapA/YwtB (metallophosphatase superfamily)